MKTFETLTTSEIDRHQQRQLESFKVKIVYVEHTQKQEKKKLEKTKKKNNKNCKGNTKRISVKFHTFCLPYPVFSIEIFQN